MRGVSVIIPCYKQAHFLPQAIESLLGQTVVPDEIVVVDDGSPDDTSAVVGRFPRPVRCLRKANAGLSAARNTGVLHSRGEWLIFLDADDQLPADAVERHLATAARHPEADLLFGDFRCIDERGDLLPGGSATGFFDDESPLHGLLRGNVFPPHAVMVRRTALANAGLFDVYLRSYEDWDMWLRVAAAGGRFAKTEGLAVLYRQYPGSMSTNLDRMTQTGLQVVRKARQYHPGCRLCRRLIRNTRWGLRHRALRQRLHASGGDPLRSFRCVVSSLRADPGMMSDWFYQMGRGAGRRALKLFRSRSHGGIEPA